MSEPTSTPFCRLRLDERRRIVGGDERFVATFGVPVDDVVGRPLSSLVSRKDRRGLRAFDAAVAAGGLDARLDLLLTLSLGGRDYLTRVRGRRDSEGWWMWLEDVLAHEDDLLSELQLARARWSVVHARSDEGIAMLDVEDRLVQFNDRFFELMAFESVHRVRLNEEALTGKDIFELLRGAAFEPLREAARQARTRKKLRFEEVIAHGEAFLDFKLSPIHLPVTGFVGWCLTVRDVTHEELLKQLTGELKRKNEDISAMLGNLRQGICTVLPELVVHEEYSSYLERMLGTTDIAGRNVMDLVFAGSDLGDDVQHQIEATLRLCMSSDTLTFELNEHLLVRELTLLVGGERCMFEADWVPLTGASGAISRVMLSLRDVTELRGLQAEADAQREELRMLGQLLRTSPNDYGSAMTSAQRLLAEAARIVEEQSAHADGVREQVDVLFRLMHTVKGDARSHGWQAVADAAHRIETTFDRARRGAGCDGDEVVAQLGALRETLARYRHAWEVTLGRSAGSEDEITVSAVWVDELLDLMRDHGSEAARRRVVSLGYPALAEVCEPPHRALARAAEGRGKTVPTLEIDSAGLRPRRSLLTPLRQILNHLMTNAFDHGIEEDATRRARGKPVPAVIEVQLAAVGDAVHLRVGDDGRGLDCAALRDRHHDAADDELLELIFLSGASTTSVVTAYSGRGVGLDAARDLAQRLGGNLVARYLGDEDEHRRRPIDFQLELPRALFVCDGPG